jgi:hypothetical protein
MLVEWSSVHTSAEVGRVCTIVFWSSAIQNTSLGAGAGVLEARVQERSTHSTPRLQSPAMPLIASLNSVYVLLMRARHVKRK